MQRHHRLGFSLVELAVVLTVVGLLAAGILVGRSLIQAAESRAIASELTIYSGAYKEFVDKYQALPGDMNNATSYWYSDTSCPNTTSNTTAKVPTCNGDGNGMIGDWTNGATATAGSEREWFRAWQQLANAGFINGMYSGVMGSGGSTEALVGTNVPQSDSGKGGWTLMWMGSTTDNNYFFASVPVASHTLIYGAQTTASFTETPALSPVDMKALDEKLDDAMPFTGKVRAKRSNASGCAVSAATSSLYALTVTTPACEFLFLMGV